MRLLTRLLTALLGLVVAALGALTVVETVWLAVRPGTTGLLVPWRSLAGTSSTIPWSDARVLGVAAGVAVVGLVLLVVAGRAHRHDIQLHDPAPGVRVATNPRSLARLVAHHVRDQDGVESASVKARRARIRIKARSHATDQRATRQRVKDTAQRAVDDLPMPRRPHISVSVSEAKEPS